MNRPYLILVNGILAARHLTRLGALKHISQLKERGIVGVLAYDIVSIDKRTNI